MGDFFIRSGEFKGFLPGILLFAQIQCGTWQDLTAVYRITLGQKSLAALFQRLWAMGLVEDVVSSANSFQTAEQVQDLGKGKTMSLPGWAKSAPMTPEGLGTSAVGTNHWLQSCCLPRAWIWDVVETYGPGLCCLALSTVHPCPQSHLPHSAWCPCKSAVG